MGFSEILSWRSGSASRSAGLVVLRVMLAVMLLCRVAVAEPVSNPLAPPDRTTPQATVRTFLEAGDALARYVEDSYLPKQSLSTYLGTRALIKTPIECLNLDGVAPAVRQKAGIAAALNLYEVLSRIDLSAIDQAPAASGGSAAAPPATWTIPNTAITLERTPRGTYVFSAETVAHAREFYDRVHQLPYRREVPLPGLGELPGTGGGWMVPYRWVAGLPWWLRHQVDGVAVWKWIASLGVLAVFMAMLRLVFYFSRAGDPANALHRAARRLSLPGFLLGALPVMAYLLMVQVNLVGSAAEAVMLLTTTLIFGAAAWLAWRSGPMIAEIIIASPRIPDDGIDAHLIRIVARLLGMSIAAGLLATGADRLGVPLYGVVAGLGVGGLALALSAQPTIENLIGGLSLFADKPMKVGDLGTYGGVTGTVEAIGIRSTRIRGSDRSLTTIPNAALSKESIVNLSQRDRLLVQTVIGLRYETSPDQMRYVLDRLRAMLEAEPRVAREGLRVRFVCFNQSSLDVELFAYVRTRDNAEFLAVREELYLRAMDVIEEAGTSIAFPSQMQYTAEREILNPERKRAAEERGRAARHAKAASDPA